MNEITSVYPTLDPENLYFPKCLEYFKVVRNISQYDHFLDDQEADKIILFNTSMNNRERDLFRIVEHRYIRSFFELLKRFNLYTYKYFYGDLNHSLQNKIEVIQVKGNDDLELKVKNGLREIEEFRFLIPQLSSIILSDYDSEVIIYTDKVESAETIFSYFEKEGFYLLGG